MSGESLGEHALVDPTVGVLGDHLDVGDRLAPGNLVGVVLVRTDEHHRPLGLRDPLEEPVAGGEVRRQPQVENVDQLEDRRGGAGAAEDHHVVVGAAHGPVDDPAGVLAEAGRLQAGARGLGVGVGVQGQDLVADEVLDEGQRPAREYSC